MSDDPLDLPEVTFGEVEEDQPDWRKPRFELDKESDDDDEDAPASESLIAVLGFDPDELDDEETDAEADAIKAIADSIARLFKP